jgi:para-aminobenzoate synthetase component 1
MTPSASARRIAALDGMSATAAAEAFRDLPGLSVLESARPGRGARWSYLTADPIGVLETAAPGHDPFAEAGGLLARLSPDPLDAVGAWSSADGGRAGPPPFAGGLVGYLGYDLGRRLERIPTIAAVDQDLPELRLALHDWVLAWNTRTGRAWLAGRAVDGDGAALDRRLAEVGRRIDTLAPARVGALPARWATGPGRATRSGVPRLEFRSGIDRLGWTGRIGAVRDAIARGEIYQANLARRLEAPFAADPWPLHRRLRAFDPAPYAAYLDLGRGRAIVSASPEPFLSIDAGGRVAADPIKGTRPRGATAAHDRRLLRDLLRSSKDRAENTMIVDVLRNDLGRVSRPESVRVTRLLRPERTTRVQHLVSTLAGDLASGRGPFDLLTASFPGGSITGAPKIRAMSVIERLEPVRRGPYSGALGWIGPDGAMATSILIRTFIADGARLTLHVGGGITWRSDPDDEWDETVAKAAGPLDAIGALEVGGPIVGAREVGRRTLGASAR